MLALALAGGLVTQDSGPNQAAHFALVRALASGTAEIDPSETIDASYVDGKYYAAKAPGLALFTLPWYAILAACGVLDGTPASATDYRDSIWGLGLWGNVLPAVVLVLLMAVAVEGVTPRIGLPTAALLGAGTMLLPFATLFFDHVLAATLGFAAFVVLLFERGDGAQSRLAAAGALAGLAIVVEFPLAIVAVVLAPYVARGGAPVVRLATYAAGGAVGVAPLLAYNTWAFGAPWRLSYTNALEAPVVAGETPVVGANDEGFYGIGFPDLRSALSLLVSEKGLFVVTPLVAVAIVGLALLWRERRRAETVVCAAVPVLFLAYNAAYYLPFGGQGPGPRFLVAAMPFLAVPLACMLRARPIATIGIGVVSVSVMAVASLTGPLTGVEYGIGTWLSRLAEGDVVMTVLGRLGVEPRWLAALAVAALLAAAIALPIGSLLRLAAWRDETLVLVTALLAWLLVALLGPDVVPASAEHGTREGTLAGILLLALVAVAVIAAQRGALGVLLLGPLVLAEPLLASRPRASLLVIIAVLAGGLLLSRRFAQPRPPLASPE